MNKLCTLAEAISLVHDGDCVGLGGNTLNRAPMAAVFELIRRGRKNLRVVKTAGAMDVDALCLGGCADVVDAGFVSYESQYGLAQRYRSFVQKGLVRANEHACYTVIVTDPFTGETLAAVQAIRPDFAIVHAQVADAQGNASFEGPLYEDALLSRAAKRVIVTAERIVGDGWFSAGEQKADIPHFMTAAVVHVPRGASPCACYGYYEPNDSLIREFLALDSREALLDFVQGRKEP